MKHAIRRTLLHLRKNEHRPRFARSKDERIGTRVARLPEFKAAKTLLLYAPIHGEVDTHGIFERARQHGKQVAFPRVNGELLEAVLVKDWAELQRGNFGVLEPAARKRLTIAKIDVVFVPGIAFDLKGHRLGYGKGFYDRFLARLKPGAEKIGLAYEFQVVDSLPVETHDVDLDAVVTEKRVLRFG